MVKRTWYLDGEEVSPSRLRILAVKEGVLNKYPSYTFANIPFATCTAYLLTLGFNLDVKTEIV